MSEPFRSYYGDKVRIEYHHNGPYTTLVVQEFIEKDNCWRTVRSYGESDPMAYTNSRLCAMNVSARKYAKKVVVKEQHSS